MHLVFVTAEVSCFAQWKRVFWSRCSVRERS